MEAKVFPIEERQKKSDLDLARFGDFRYRTETTVDARTILDQANITLYCLDDEHRQAVFVETPAGMDLSEKPFYFLTQYRHAQRVLTTTFDVLNELGDLAGDR